MLRRVQSITSKSLVDKIILLQSQTHVQMCEPAVPMTGSEVVLFELAKEYGVKHCVIASSSSVSPLDAPQAAHE